MALGRMPLLTTQPDARLVALARAGNKCAFEAIVARYRPALTRYGERIAGADPAQDAVQQALIGAWLALSGSTEVRELRPWLYAAVRNAALRGRCAATHELPVSLPAAGTPELDAERRAAVDAAIGAIAALPAQQREALVRTALDGRTHAEVAAELGVTEAAARQLVHRARAALRAGDSSIACRPPMPPPCAAC